MELEQGAADAERNPRRRARFQRLGHIIGVAKRATPRPLRPWLGRYEAQYPPRPITVPGSYLKTSPPSPAPLISIVTPSLNQGRFIGSTLASVVGQRYPRLEHMVVDGGSDDGTLDVVDQYREHISHLESRPDSGPAEAINRGLGQARGEIFCWLNSDDLLLPGALAYVARYFGEHPDVDLVYGHRLLIDEHGAEIGMWTVPGHSRDALRWLDLVPQETAFWRADLWRRLGGLREDLDSAFDWDFFRRAEAAGARIVRLPRLLGAMRQHPGQLTKMQHSQAQAEQEMLRRSDGVEALSGAEIRGRLLLHLLRSLPYQYAHLGRARLRRVRATTSSGRTGIE